MMSTGPQRLYSHPSPNINNDRQRNWNFKNHKVTSGKLIRLTKPPGTGLRRTTKMSLNILVLLTACVFGEIPASHYTLCIATFSLPFCRSCDE